MCSSDLQVANASARHRKQEHREVCSVKVAAPVYLDWSDKPITFDQDDHPDRVPSPGKYPLVVDPVIGAFLAGTTRCDLVSKLGRKTPTRASELMDIATKFASGQEVVEAIFQKDKQPQGRQPEDVPEASTQCGTKKKGKNKLQAKRVPYLNESFHNQYSII